MATNERSVELAGVNLAGQNHVCAFFNTMDEEHRVLGSFYKGGFDRGEKATHIVDSENREPIVSRIAPPFSPSTSTTGGGTPIR